MGWLSANAFTVSRSVEVLFGFVWLVDASFKFNESFVGAISVMITQAGQGQPQWLGGWFSFWSNATAANPALFAHIIAAMELLVGVSLVFGIARKLCYGGGFMLSLFIWAIPEGFGGPYGAGSTDIGTAVIYAFVFVLLAVISGIHGPDSRTLDFHIGKRLHWWGRIANVKIGK